MPAITKLSEIVTELDELIRGKFTGKSFWISAELSGVKKYPDKRWCFFDFVEKNENGETLMKGVSWARSYQNIELFENSTGIEFKSGIEITCKVCVSFYKAKSYPQLEILEIDFAHAIGQLELEKQKTLKRLIAENKTIKYLPDGRYRTANNALELPKVIQRIALITAANSDGQRDFKKVTNTNKYGYAFSIQEYLTVVQGKTASKLILEKLKLIQPDNFDIVVIVRGGGSDTDFAAFNDYELAKSAATFSIPILTGIGHDRNTSIVDLMTRQLRTPTEVGTFIVDRNMNFEYDLQQLRDRFFEGVEDLILDRKETLIHFKQRVKNLHPTTIMKKGFAIIKSDNKIVTDPKNVKVNSELQTILKNEIIVSTVTKKSKNEKQSDI
ncbi:MAG: exodeoxyribonuclease VII large subunit [Candidatus Kapabacteria bacterium]|nr:exodeoxyribonuclease VII large subunit [Candidatus Kapabacteria bacterium]